MVLRFVHELFFNYFIVLEFLQCLSPGEIYHVFGLRPGLDTVGSDVFVDLCPALIYELEKKTCRQPKYDFHEEHSDHHGEGYLDNGDGMSSTTQSSSSRFFSRMTYVLKGLLSLPRNDMYGAKCHAGSNFENLTVKFEF